MIVNPVITPRLAAAAGRGCAIALAMSDRETWVPVAASVLLAATEETDKDNDRTLWASRAMDAGAALADQAVSDRDLAVARKSHALLQEAIDAYIAAGDA